MTFIKVLFAPYYYSIPDFNSFNRNRSLLCNKDGSRNTDKNVYNIITVTHNLILKYGFSVTIIVSMDITLRCTFILRHCVQSKIN